MGRVKVPGGASYYERGGKQETGMSGAAVPGEYGVYSSRT